MKKIHRLVLAAITSGCLFGVARAQTPVTMVDLGPGVNPTPGANDQYQTNTGSGPVPGLNYWFNSSPPAGQTFTTGPNANGYLLNSLAVYAGGQSGGLPAGGQPLYLNIFAVSGSNATFLASYVSQTNFTFNDLDWLEYTGLTGLALAPNSQYAWTWSEPAVGGQGYENIGNVSDNPYAGGQACAIPSIGGTINFGSTNIYDASFDVGLSVVTSLIVDSPLFSPSTPGNIVTNGAPVTVSALAFGPATLHYQWRTDGGSGGSLTNISAAVSSSLAINTTSLTPGVYQYEVVVTNSSQAATSTVASLTVTYPTAAVPFVDVGSTIAPGTFDISQLVGNGGGDGLNYYNNNGFNNSLYTSQTFTTGNNPQGYTLNTLTVATGGSGYAGDGSAFVSQPYDLYIYTVKGAQATLLKHYINSNPANDPIVWMDYLQWSNLSLTLAANSTYAYGFGNESGGGYAAMSCSPGPTDLYTGGQIALISPAGGPIVFGTSGKVDAAFDLGLSPIGGVPAHPATSPIAIYDNSNGNLLSSLDQNATTLLARGKTLNLSVTATGASSLYYQWQTDGGSGGALTNLPPNNASNLVVNTSALRGGVYQYDVIVTNSSGVATSAVANITLEYADTTATLTDIGGAAPTPGPNDISQLTFGDNGNPPGPGINYYWNDSTAPGQTFTTGTNPSGYTMSTLAIQLAGNGNLVNNPQSFVLRIYSMSGSNATIYASYTSQPLNASLFGIFDWLQWSGFNVPFLPNKVYAYSFYGPDGWSLISNVPGINYPGGQLAQIPSAGGAVTYSTDSSFDATFDLGFIIPPPTLTIQPGAGGKVELQWNSGTLLQSRNAAGPWSVAPGATSPYMVSPTNPYEFYRVVE